MAQIRNPLEEVRIPFAKMTFSPDVPSTALGPNEYNQGLNIETDVRGIRSTAGDQAIFDALPTGAKPVYVSAGFRRSGEYWFIVALEGGFWYASNGQLYQYDPLPAPKTMWYDITPPGYSATFPQNANITEAWNGNVVFFNEVQTPPIFWLDENPSVTPTPTAKMTMYSNQIPLDISDIAPFSVSTKLITFADTQPTPPFAIGSTIVLSDVTPRAYDGPWTVVNCTNDDVEITCDITQAYNTGGTVAPEYSWNYNPDWQSVGANFMRIYNTPNVGSILVAGNLRALNLQSAYEYYPVTVQWSQAFGLNQAPKTWEPTVLNVANQLEVPLRGPALDAFPCNGQFFLCSYWDTVVFSPLNYTTTAAPILGVRLFNQGRGLLSANCCVNTDKMIYGVDARDFWVFDGQSFTGIGNQRVKNWFYDQLDSQFYDRVFMQVNTQKNQIECYYPDRDATDGIPNKMISYRYDLDCWNAPREVSRATMACESPIYTPYKFYDNLFPTTVTGTGNNFKVDVERNETSYSAVLQAGGTGYAVGNTVKILGTILGGETPTNDLVFTITGISGPGPTGPVTTFTTAGTARLIWEQNPGSRTIVYANVDPTGAASTLVQKDIGYSFLDNAEITSYYRRDNLKLLKDYSGKLMVHRILPESVNIGAVPFSSTDETVITPSPGQISITVEGANSVGSLPASVTPITMNLDTDNPWCQINQNAHRVNSIEMGNTSNTNIWMTSAITWQYTQVEDDR